MELAVLVPVKRFGAAKGRLRGVMADDDRIRLARWMAERVLDAVAEAPVFVACDDGEVRDWAHARGARTLWGPGLGLNGAVDDGVRRLVALGARQIVVSHADLPLPSRLLEIGVGGRVTLAPDRRRDGTNVMSFPAATPLRASYGAGSFQRHLDQARGIPDAIVEVRYDPELSLDVDTLDDVLHPLVRPLIREVLPRWQRTSPVNPHQA